jgi:hypothetical protein
LATTSHSPSAPEAPRLAARPYPTLPPVGSSRTPGPAAASGAPSSLPLSASTTSYGRLVAARSEARKSPSAGPGE